MLDRAAREKAEAEAKMNELNARLSKLDAELVEIRKQTEREAQTERARLEAEAIADAEKLRVTAQREIEGAKQTALLQLREFTANKSVELAEQLIRRELTPQDDAKLLQRVSEELTKVS
jgi:F0F1-type ATP synthase membrane subunit b/b'